MEVNAIGRHDMATLSAFDDFVVVNVNKLLNKRSSGGDLRRHDVHVTSP